VTRIYPNGEADVNHFHAAGGTGFVMRTLLDAGMLHDDVTTILGHGLRAHCMEAFIENGKAVWKPAPATSADENVLRSAERPFAADGGLRLLSGNLGRAVIKVSAVQPQHRLVEAPALVFDSQEEFMRRYHAGELQRDFVAVVRFQGPRANGMPELHALTPALANLQDAGCKVALVTDGRMSGASGKIPAAIHVSPEILAGGPLGRIRDGDVIRLDAEHGSLQALVAEDEWQQRPQARADLSSSRIGMGRELFAMFRAGVSIAEEGATTFGLPYLFEATSPEVALPSGAAMPFSDEDTNVQQAI
jgi:phosphogluconate dehydratase